MVKRPIDWTYFKSNYFSYWLSNDEASLRGLLYFLHDLCFTGEIVQCSLKKPATVSLRCFTLSKSRSPLAPFGFNPSNPHIRQSISPLNFVRFAFFWTAFPTFWIVSSNLQQFCAANYKILTIFKHFWLFHFQVHLGAIWWITMSMLNYAKLQSWVNSIEEPISPVIRPRHSSELLSRAFYLLLLRGFYDDGCFISRIGSRVKLSNCRWNWSRFLFNAIALNWIVELLTWSTNSSTMNQLDQNNGRSSFNSHSIELAVNFQTNLLYVSINSYRLLLFYQKFGNLACFQFENELFSVINPTQRFRSD